MFGKPSLMTRIAVGKGIGLLVGLVGFFLLPSFVPEAGALARWGILLWYITFGAIIGMTGVITWNPVLKIRMPWWLFAPLMGAWLNFVLTFFAYDLMAAAMASAFGEGGVLRSPFWFVAEGAIIGFLIGFAATRLGGEGPEAAAADQRHAPEGPAPTGGQQRPG